jgi:hypothetical protein
MHDEEALCALTGNSIPEMYTNFFMWMRGLIRHYLPHASVNERIPSNVQSKLKELRSEFIERVVPLR